MEPQASRVLITGGAGFIGAHLAARCLDQGDDVHVVARPSSCIDRLAALAGRLDVHRLQFDDRAALERCLAAVRPERIYHLASRSRWREASDLGPDFSDVLDSIDVELRGLVTLLTVSASSWRPPKIFVRTGTLAEYGAGPTPYLETQREVAASTYGTAMAAGTHYAQMLQPRLPFPVITTRLALVYGPAQSERFLIPSLIERCLAREPSVVRNPDDRRDLLHVDDAVQALCRLATTATRGTVVNIATGVAPTMREVAALIVRATGAAPGLVTFASAGERSSELRASTEYARERFGWEARIPLAEGIGRTVEWFRAQQALEMIGQC